jgi:hypothetical protein
MGDTDGAVDGVIKEDRLAGGWGEDKLDLSDDVVEGDNTAGDSLEAPGVAEDDDDEDVAAIMEEPPQPPRLEDKGADIGTRPSGFVSEQDAPPEEEEPTTPEEELRRAKDRIKELVEEKLKLTRELNESEAEINAYFAAFGPLPTKE